MSNNEAKNRSQTLPYLKALLTHSTPCHNPKNTQENTSLSPTPKKCLHKHEHKYARHKSPTKTKQQVSHCINKPAGLALHQQTSRSRTASTNKHFSHCTHMSRGKLENVSTNTQNGPKSKQRFDLLHKRKQKHTHHKPKTTQSPDLTLKALLTHSTPCHNPKNTQENALLAPTPKKCLHEHEHKYARHSPSTNNNQQALHCIKEPVGLALLQTSKSRTMSTNQLASHCIHRSRGKSENVSKNTQNGPKSKQGFDLLHKRKQKHTQHKPKTKQSPDLTLKNRFAILQEPTMNAQHTFGAGKRKKHELQTDAFKKKSIHAAASRTLEGYTVKISKVSIVTHDGTRSTTTKMAINRSRARIIVEQLKKHYRLMLRGPPLGLNLDTICCSRLTDAAHVVKMVFNSDEATMTTANENANNYVAGEPTINIPIGHEFATLQCEPDDTSQLSVVHVTPMGKVIDAEGTTISLNNTTATKSISRKHQLDLASYLQEPQGSLEAAYGTREFARMDTDSDGKQTATVWFAPTNRDKADITVAQGEEDQDKVASVYGRAASRTPTTVDFEEILEDHGALTTADMGEDYDQAYGGHTTIVLSSVITPMRLLEIDSCQFCWSVYLSQQDGMDIDEADGEKQVMEGKWTTHRHASCKNQYAYEMRRSAYKEWNTPRSDNDALEEEQQVEIAQQTAETIEAVNEARQAWKSRREGIAQRAATRRAAASAATAAQAGTEPLKSNSGCTNLSINVKPTPHTETITPPCEPHHQHHTAHRKPGGPHATAGHPERDNQERERPTGKFDAQGNEHAKSQISPLLSGGKQIKYDKQKAHQIPRTPPIARPLTPDLGNVTHRDPCGSLTRRRETWSEDIQDRTETSCTPLEGERLEAFSPQSVEHSNRDNREIDPCRISKQTLEYALSNLPTNPKSSKNTNCPKTHDPPQMPHRPISVEKQQGGKANQNGEPTALDTHTPKDDGIRHDTGIESWLSDLEIYNITKSESLRTMYPLTIKELITSLKRKAAGKRVAGPLAAITRRHMFIPVNTGQHWVAFMIDHKARNILYVDPSGKTLSELDTNLNSKIHELLQQSFCTYDILDLHFPLQEDDHNCGVWIVWLNSIWNRHITEQIHGATSSHNTALLRRIYESIITNRLINTQHYQHILDPSHSPKQRRTTPHALEQHHNLLKTLLQENREHSEPHPRKNETYIHDYRSQLRRELDDGLRGIPKQRNQTSATKGTRTGGPAQPTTENPITTRPARTTPQRTMKRAQPIDELTCAQ